MTTPKYCLTVRELIEQLRQMPQDSFVELEEDAIRGGVRSVRKDVGFVVISAVPLED